MTDRLIPLAEVRGLISVSRSTLYRMVERNQFPKPAHIGTRLARWWQSDVSAWLESKRP